jgi:hypothetical protein
MAHKCTGFARPIDPDSEGFKNFKRVMDKRNHAIHGNCDPEREKIELVYFEETLPLFATALRRRLANGALQSSGG